MSAASLGNENGQILLVSKTEINRSFLFLLRDFPKKQATADLEENPKQTKPQFKKL